MTEAWASVARCECGGDIGTIGGQLQCVACGKRKARRVPVECYSRIVGYLRPVQNWNKAKKLEFEERAVYTQPSRGDLEEM